MDTHIIPIKNRAVMVCTIGVELRGNEYSTLASAVRNRCDANAKENHGRVIQVFRVKPFFKPARYTVCVDRVPVAIAQEISALPRIVTELSQLFVATLGVVGGLYFLISIFF